MGRRPTAATMAATMGAPPHLNLRLLALGFLTGLCISLAYGSPSQSFDKISLVDDSEVGQHNQKEEVAVVDSLLETNEDIDDSAAGALRVPRNSENDDSKNKQKKKKKVEKQDEKEKGRKKNISKPQSPKKSPKIKENKQKKNKKEPKQNKNIKKVKNDKEKKQKGKKIKDQKRKLIKPKQKKN